MPRGVSGRPRGWPGDVCWWLDLGGKKWGCVTGWRVAEWFWPAGQSGPVGGAGPGRGFCCRWAGGTESPQGAALALGEVVLLSREG